MNKVAAALVLGVSLLGFSATSSAVEYFKTDEDGKLLMLNPAAQTELNIKLELYTTAMKICYRSNFKTLYRFYKKGPLCNTVLKEIYKGFTRFLQETK